MAASSTEILKGYMQPIIHRCSTCAVPWIIAVATRIGSVLLKCSLEGNSAACTTTLAALILWCLRSEDWAIGSNGAFLCGHIIVVNCLSTIIGGESEPPPKRCLAVTERILNFEVRYLLVLAVYFRVWSSFPWIAAWLFSAARLLLAMYRCGCHKPNVVKFYSRSFDVAVSARDNKSHRIRGSSPSRAASDSALSPSGCRDDDDRLPLKLRSSSLVPNDDCNSHGHSATNREMIAAGAPVTPSKLESRSVDASSSRSPNPRLNRLRSRRQNCVINIKGAHERGLELAACHSKLLMCPLLPCDDAL